MPESTSRIRPVIAAITVHWPEGPDSGPDDVTHFGVLVWAYLTVAGAKGMDPFDLFVCSPSGLADAYSHQPVNAPLDWMDGRADWLWGLMLMSSWDEEILRQRVDERCEKFALPDGQSLLCDSTVPCHGRRIIPWEFDYEYDTFVDEHPGPPWPP